MAHSEISHYAGLTYWSPLAEAPVEALLDAARVPAGARALDLGCGRGEILIRLGERCGVCAVGVDRSEAALALARAGWEARVPGGEAEWVRVAAENYEAPAAGFEFVSWLGGPYLGADFPATLGRLRTWLRPGGSLLLGHGYWAEDPPAPYLEATGISPEEFGPLAEIETLAADLGLRLEASETATREDWDHFEGTILSNSETYAREHPEAPDPSGRLEQRRAWALAQQRWGRETMGFATLLFRRA